MADFAAVALWPKFRGASHFLVLDCHVDLFFTYQEQNFSI